MQIKKIFNDVKEKYGVDPVLEETDEYIILKLFEMERITYDINPDDSTETTKRVLIQRTKNPRFVFIAKENDLTYDIYFDIKRLKLAKSFEKFLILQDIKDEYISLIDKTIEAKFKYKIINKSYFDNYLKNISFQKRINFISGNIIRDKFKVNKTGDKAPTTQALLTNIGYIIKKDQERYLELSKTDYGFIRNFVNNLIADGNYEVKITESLPMYKEDIKKIIEIGRELLKLKRNKQTIKRITLKYLGESRSSIEGAWQLYFEKYLRLFFMSYKSFYSNVVFKPIDNTYEKDSIPDFLAVDLYNNIDIIEIKKHDTVLFSKEYGRDSVYPSAELTKSVFQLNKYLDLTADLIKTEKIDDNYIKSLIENNKIYRPRGILIISSKKHIGAKSISSTETLRIEKEIKKIKSTYANIDIVLFDELIDSLSKYLEQIEISISNKKKGDF